jgi:hypothetical protein
MNTVVDIEKLAQEFDTVHGTSAYLVTPLSEAKHHFSNPTIVQLDASFLTLFKASNFLEHEYLRHVSTVSEEEQPHLHIDADTYNEMLNAATSLFVTLQFWYECKNLLLCALQGKGITIPEGAHPFYDVDQDSLAQFGYFYSAE